MLQGAFDFVLPQSTWVAPSHLPSLAGAKFIAIDTETLDPGLKEKGPGFLRGTGKLVGISISWETTSRYFPLGHTYGGNLDRELTVDWLNRELIESGAELVFANAQYDLGWLRQIGVNVAGRVHDVQIMDPLLDSERSDGYSLGALCKRWLGETKNEDLLRQAASAHGKGDPKECMDQLDPKYVGPYAEADARQTLQIFHKIRAHPEWQHVEKLYNEVEQPLITTLFEMMWRGVRVDTNYADQLNKKWKKQEEGLYTEIGFRDIWNGKECAKVLRAAGVHVGVSVDKNFLQSISHPLGNKIRAARELNRCRETFLEQNILLGSRAGRIHPQYVQLSSDEGGTRSGRLACKNPNAQQFPKRSVNVDTKAIRKALIPEEGCQWAKFDYWSQEPVIQCHYGIASGLPKAQEVAEMFAKGVKLYKFIEQNSKGKLNYDQAKEVALARSYGQQTAGLAAKMGMAFDEAERIQEDFDEIVPYIKMLADLSQTRAGDRGYVTTLLGRRQRFNLYQPKWNDNKEDRYLALTLEDARKKWGDKAVLKRAFLYKALNWLIQGSAADQTKLALVRVHREVGLPQMTVHDEISSSVLSKEQALHIKQIMETCVKLKAPVRADMDLGPTWQ
jgi:DNA polymerase I-like protein with 3'-5' exonuclease and polymerase domains